MNSRERFLATMRFKSPDKVPLPCLFQRFEAETLRRWQREGLPRDAHVVRYFGFERCELAPVNLGLLPAAGLADATESQEWQMGDREHEEETVARSDEVKATYPLRAAAQWPSFQCRLDPASPARYPQYWAGWSQHRRDRDYPLGLAFAGPFSAMREWMGVRTLDRALKQDQGWVEEMVEYLGDFATAAAGRAVEDLNPDFAVVDERTAYRWPSVATTSELAGLLGPWYRKLSDFLAGAGVTVRLVEAPGAVTDLIPMWLQSGLNGLYFAEVSAGLDVRALRAKYGRELAVIGNVDERALASSRRDVADELLGKVAELSSAGGYIPTPDRPVSSDVAFEDYEYYLANLRKL